MDAAPAASGEFEVLHCVGDGDPPPVYSCFLQSGVQQLSRWPNERTANDIFLIARLLPNEQDAGAMGTFTKHGLCCRCTERTAFTTPGLARKGPCGAGLAFREDPRANWRTVERARVFIQIFRL